MGIARKEGKTHIERAPIHVLDSEGLSSINVVSSKASQRGRRQDQGPKNGQ